MDSTTESMTHVYDGLAGDYDRLYGRTLDRGRRLGIQAMAIESGMRVLEIGIGTGLSLALYPPGTHLVGIDNSREMLARARERLRRLPPGDVELAEMSGERLEFPDGSFDRIFAPSVLTAMSHPEAAVAEMARVCKPAGRICVVSHFSGGGPAALLDRMLDPISRRYLGYRCTLQRSILEDNPALRILRKRQVLPYLNTLYLLERA